MSFEQMTPPGQFSEAAAPIAQAPVLTDRSFLVRSSPSHFLPPPEAWLIDPYDEKNWIHPPTDERGLIDGAKHIKSVMSTVDEAFKWSYGNLSVHHLYYTESQYRASSAGPFAASFRELPIHKVIMPRMLENWLHLISYIPDMPAQEVMEKRNESWSIAKNLFDSVRGVRRHDRLTVSRQNNVTSGKVTLPKAFEGEDRVGKAYLKDLFERQFEGLLFNMELLEEIEPADRIVEPVQDLRCAAKRREYATQLGRVMVPRATPMQRLLEAA